MAWTGIVLAVLARLPGTAHAQTPTLAVPDTAGIEATSLSIPVRLQGVASLSNFQFSLAFNSDRVRYESFSTPIAELSGSGANVLGVDGGVDTLVVAGSTSNAATLNPSADTVLVVLTFSLESAGTTGLTFVDYAEINACGAVPPTGPSDCLTAASGSVQVDTVVPVVLIGFEGIADGEDAVLTWRTASETSNAGFTVEHYTDHGFDPVAFVPGQGTTVQPQAYRYRVRDLAPGRHTFRLVQVDLDGTTATYGPLDVVIAPPQAFFASPAYPNPFNPVTRITLSVTQTQTVRVTAHDVLGREVAVVLDGVVAAGSPQQATFDATRLPSGLYVLQVESAAQRMTQTVLLAK